MRVQGIDLDLDDLEAALDRDWPNDVFMLCECGMVEVERGDEFEDTDDGHAIVAVIVPQWGI